MSGFASAALAIAMIAAFLLIAGGLHLILRQRDAKKGALMLAAALVLVGNVVIWTI